MTLQAVSERKSTVAEAMRVNIIRALEDAHFCLPAVVTAYDATKQMVSVKPLIKHAFTDEDDVRQVESLGVVNNVPVQFLSAGGFLVTCPITAGKTTFTDPFTGATSTPPATIGTLLFSESSLDAWLTGLGAEVDPGVGFDHRNALSDGIFIPGLNPFGAPLKSVPADHAALGADNGVQLHQYAGGMIVAKPGSTTSADFVALAAKVLTELQRIASAFSGHTHGYLAPPTGGVPSTTSPVGTVTPQSVAATQLKTV